MEEQKYYFLKLLNELILFSFLFCFLAIRYFNAVRYMYSYLESTGRENVSRSRSEWTRRNQPTIAQVTLQ